MKKHRLWYITIVTVMLAVYIIANRKEALVFMGGLILVPVVLALIHAGAVSSLTIECNTTCAENQKAKLFSNRCSETECECQEQYVQ